jgi:hypothetical protein
LTGKGKKYSHGVGNVRVFDVMRTYWEAVDENNIKA